jgi:polyphenol oxidase
MFYKDARGVYRVQELDRLPWLDHGFGSRASEGWVPGPLVWVKQIHSDRCLVADGVSGCLGEADGLISNSAGQYLSIRTADCIPVLLADERLRVVAAIHAGWRGSAAAIAVKAVEAMQGQFGSCPGDLVAAIGPGICGLCYEVGAEVASRFAPWFPERSDLDQRTTLDLADANRRQLSAAGLGPNRIFASGLCTACHSEEFYSWRREHIKTGRLVSAIAIRSGL